MHDSCDSNKSKEGFICPKKSLKARFWAYQGNFDKSAKREQFVLMGAKNYNFGTASLFTLETED
jgi:hypothetical protein